MKSNFLNIPQVVEEDRVSKALRTRKGAVLRQVMKAGHAAIGSCAMLVSDTFTLRTTRARNPKPHSRRRRDISMPISSSADKKNSGDACKPMVVGGTELPHGMIQRQEQTPRVGRLKHSFCNI